MGALVLALSLDRWISRRLRRMPHRIIDDGRLEGVGGRIRALQRQLAEIRGDRPNPLRTKKLGKAILAELCESMSDEDIERRTTRSPAAIPATCGSKRRSRIVGDWSHAMSTDFSGEGLPTLSWWLR